MALPRLQADPKSLSARIPYADFLDTTQHIQGRVTALSDTSAKVTLNDGLEKLMTFHYALISTGSASLDPLIKALASNKADRAAQIFCGRRRNQCTGGWSTEFVIQKQY